MNNEITGTFTPTHHKSWVAHTIDITKCICHSSHFDDLLLVAPKGTGVARRNYAILTMSGDPVVTSKPFYKGWFLSRFSGSTSFFEAKTGNLLASFSGKGIFLPTKLMFGDNVVEAVWQRKLTTRIFKSEHFHFEWKGINEIQFQISPNYFLQSLSVGFFYFFLEEFHSAEGRRA